MRLALIIRNLAGLAGGAERGLISLAGAMRARGHDVRIFTFDKTDGAPHYPLEPSVPLSNLHPKARPARERPASGSPDVGRDEGAAGRRAPLKRFAHRSKLFRDVASRLRHRAAATRIARALDDWPPDVLCAFMPNAITPTRHALARLRGKGASFGAIASLRITPDFDFPTGSADDRAAAKAKINLDALEAFDAITVQWASFAERLPAALRGRCRAIANEIDLALFARPDAPPLAERPRVVLFVGRLVRDKRPGLLLDAFTAAAPEDWRLRFVGDGPERAALEARAAPLGARVAFEPPRRGIERVYEEAQIIAAPSLLEGFPRALSEGMAAGLAPLAIADCEGAAQLVRHAGIEPAPDAAAFADHLRHALENEAARIDAGRRAAAGMRAFAPDRIFDQWEALFAELATRGR